MKKKLMMGFLCICVLGGAYPAKSSCAPEGGLMAGVPWAAADAYRIIEYFIAGIMELTGDGDWKAKLIAKQEENNQNANGGGGSAGSTDTSDALDSTVDSSTTTETDGTAATNQFTGSAFDHVYSYVFTKNGNVGYEPVKSALSGNRQSIRNKVLEIFYADPLKDEQKTTEYQKKIHDQRVEYITEAAKRHMWLAYHVKGYIQNDLQAIASAPLTGDGEIGLISVDSHTLEQAIKMELVEMAMQIELMEADAIHFMMRQPITLLSETKPSGGTSCVPGTKNPDGTFCTCAIGITYPEGSPCRNLGGNQSGNNNQTENNDDHAGNDNQAENNNSENETQDNA